MKKNGFTMLELIVAVGVFSVVAMLSVSSLLSLTGAQKKALAIQSVQDNLRVALRAIQTDIISGDFFYCGADFSDLPPEPDLGEPPMTKDCPAGTSGGSMMTFLNAQKKVVTYRVSNGAPDASCDPSATGHRC